MTTNFLKRLATFVTLCLVQSLVLNNIHVFGCATPLLYVYFVLQFRRNYPKWAILLWCFCLGVAIDTFSNTPGVTSASLVVIGAIQPYYFEMFLPHEAADDLKPSVRNMGFVKFLFYSFVMTLLFCSLFFTLETFNFFNWVQWLECVGGSVVLTIVLILTIESVRK